MLLSNPLMDEHAIAQTTWGYNIGGFERHYTGWRLESPDGLCLVARPRGGGKRLKGQSLDELAALIDAAESETVQQDGPRRLLG